MIPDQPGPRVYARSRREEGCWLFLMALLYVAAVVGAGFGIAYAWSKW